VSFLKLAITTRFAILQTIMGDKSPKATSKKAAQKQIKADSNTQRKNQAIDAKHVVKANK
jgi:hypothetical protein